MLITEQSARIRKENDGFTVIHSGSTYKKNGLCFSSAAISEVSDRLSLDDYKDAVIYSNVDHSKEVLTITHIRLC